MLCQVPSSIVVSWLRVLAAILCLERMYGSDALMLIRSVGLSLADKLRSGCRCDRRPLHRAFRPARIVGEVHLVEDTGVVYRVPEGALRRQPGLCWAA